jgi:Uma2 family endonuclease
VNGEPVRPDTTPSVRLTYEDFLNFPDDGKRHEIINGDHYVTPSPNTEHQAVSACLTAMLWTYLEQHPIGRVFAAPFDVVFSNLDVVEPDLLYISRERIGLLTEKHVRGAPDLVVEILSPGTRKTDEATKLKLYERFDVREYWIVDPEQDAIKVYRRVEGTFSHVAELSAEPGDLLTTPLLPEWSASLTKIFSSPAYLG